MIRATFIAHSGFLVELDGVSLLFDWWKGELPGISPEKPLLVFASHRHQDHFKPEIFALDDGARDVRFLLGKGIQLSSRNLKAWGVSPAAAEKCRVLKGGETVSPLPGVTVETLPSTDEGVAFLVTAGKTVVYHAGDLNWWHWEGEDPAWNRNMEVDFKRYLEPLRGRKIDLAMVPLDSRLGEPGFWGPKYFLDLTNTAHMLPMHQWEDFAFTEKFLSAHPEYAKTVTPVSNNGETFAFPD